MGIISTNGGFVKNAGRIIENHAVNAGVEELPSLMTPETTGARGLTWSFLRVDRCNYMWLKLDYILAIFGFLVDISLEVTSNHFFIGYCKYWPGKMDGFRSQKCPMVIQGTWAYSLSVMGDPQSAPWLFQYQVMV